MIIYQYPPQPAASAPVGGATSANQVTEITKLTSIDNKTLTAGQKTMANSYPVAIASDQSAIPVTGTFYQATQPVSGPLTDTQLRATPVPVSGPLTDTQLRATPVPVSGTITASNAANGTNGAAAPTISTQIGGSDGTNLRPVKVSAAGVVSVDGSAVTQPISAAALPLPTGASTSANQATAITSLQSIDSKLPTVGQKTMAASQPTVIASDQTPIQDQAATGSLTALNSTVVISTSGEASAVFEIAGTWVGTFTFEASNNGFTTSQAVAAVFLGGLASQSSSFSANGFYSVLAAGFKQVRVRMSAYTSGTATVLANSSIGNRISVVLQGNPVNLQVMSTPASIAGTAVTTAQVSYGTTAVRLTVSGSAPNAARKMLKIKPNISNSGRTWIGPSSVTTANGLEIVGPDRLEFPFDVTDYYVISDTASQSIDVFEVV